MRRVTLLAVILAATTAVAQDLPQCVRPDARPLRFYVVSIAGVEASTEDVLIVRGACRYLWHGSEGAYAYDAEQKHVTFTPDEDTGGKPPWGGVARVNGDGRLYFPIDRNETQFIVTAAAKDSRLQRLCPFFPFC